MGFGLRLGLGFDLGLELGLGLWMGLGLGLDGTGVGPGARIEAWIGAGAGTWAVAGIGACTGTGVHALRNMELNNNYFLYVSLPFLCIPCYHLVFCVITLYLCPLHLLSSASVPHISCSGHA